MDLFFGGNEMACEYLLLPKNKIQVFGMEMVNFFIWPFVRTAPVVLLLARTISCTWHTMQLGTAVRRLRRLGGGIFGILDDAEDLGHILTSK